VSRRVENDRRYRLRSEAPSSATDHASNGRSATGLLEKDAGIMRVRRREEPCGRRSLTGVEFRRQRSS